MAICPSYRLNYGHMPMYGNTLFGHKSASFEPMSMKFS